MIVTENFEIGERHFIRTYSNSGRFVMRDGMEYIDAEDPAEFGRTYTEGALIPMDENELVRLKAEAFDILMGEE